MYYIYISFSKFWFHISVKVKKKINKMPKRGGGGRNTRRPKTGLDDLSVEDEQEQQYAAQTDQEKRVVRNRIRDIFQRLLEEKDKIKDGIAGESEVLGRLLKEAEEVVAGVKGTHEAIEDAKMFRELCKTVRELSEDTNTNEKRFSIDEYAEIIGRFSNAVQDNNDVKLNKNQFLRLGNKFNTKFARVPAFTFILGAIDTEVGEVKKKKQREKRPERERAVVATKTAIVSRSQADGQQRTSKLVESTGKILERKFLQNNKKPVDYFKFVIDPESFGKTVENMFHVSFLVKQRVVELGVSEKVGLPILTPLSSGSRAAAGDEGESEGKNQAIISLSYDQWEDLKEALEVTSASIVHGEDLRKI